MKIGLAKFGISIDFGPNYRQIDNDFQRLIVNMARNNPNDQFYYINPTQRLNLKLRSMFPHQNVFRITDEVVLDLLITNNGPTAKINMSGVFTGSKGNKLRTLQLFEKYVAPICRVINRSPRTMKWVNISVDPRNATCPAADIFRRPDLELAQANWSIPGWHFTSYDDQTPVEYVSKGVYYPVELIKIIDTKLNLNPTEKDGFGMICMPGADISNNKKLIYRLPILKEWIFDQNIDGKVYGKWPKEIMQIHPQIQGYIPNYELLPIIDHWKYTMVIPIGNGWISSKYAEMISQGTIPFCHPLYDRNRLINLPDILYLQKPTDLPERIAYLDNNPTEYKRLQRTLFEYINRHSWISGQEINERLYQVVNPNYKFQEIPCKHHNWESYYHNSLIIF